jgi:hypothetical protein
VRDDTRSSRAAHQANLVPPGHQHLPLPEWSGRRFRASLEMPLRAVRRVCNCQFWAFVFTGSGWQSDHSGRVSEVADEGASAPGAGLRSCSGCAVGRVRQWPHCPPDCDFVVAAGCPSAHRPVGHRHPGSSQATAGGRRCRRTAASVASKCRQALVPGSHRLQDRGQLQIVDQCRRREYAADTHIHGLTGCRCAVRCRGLPYPRQLDVLRYRQAVGRSARRPEE